MRDITFKQSSLREASAEGYVFCARETLNRILAGNLPKGDPFGFVKAAGMLAAKNTSNLIPHCHPVSIDSLDIQFSFINNVETNKYGVKISVTAKSIGRTGIEMEALTSVSVSCLTLYDLLKPIDKELEISGIQLLAKKGGKSDKKFLPPKGLTAAILVTSDSTFQGTRKDKSGIIIKEILESYSIQIHEYKIVPDEESEISKAVLGWSKENVSFIFTTGGTGLGPRDVTVDTLQKLIEREIPGIPEAMRVHGYLRTPWAMLSRSVAGVIGKSIVISLPGSSNGAKESLEAILPGVFHGIDMILGGGH